MKKLFLFLYFINSSIYYCQEVIHTDRPDQTESVAITPKGMVQIEAGFLFEKNNYNSENISHPTILWKYGINEIFEVRLITEFITEKKFDEHYTGISPISIGFKTKLMEENKLLPSVSFLGHLTINNWASKNFTADYLSPDFRFLFHHTLAEKWSLGYNVGLEWNGNPNATYLYTIATNYFIHNKLGTFVELYGFLQKDLAADHRFNGGIIYIVHSNLQIDASAGIGISNIYQGYFLSCGISYRFATP